jgi:hypothetical protein
VGRQSAVGGGAAAALNTWGNTQFRDRLLRGNKFNDRRKEKREKSQPARLTWYIFIFYDLKFLIIIYDFMIK